MSEKAKQSEKTKLWHYLLLGGFILGAVGIAIG